MDIYGNEVYNIRQVLEKMADILQGIQDVMCKPENPVVKTLKFFVLLAGAMGIMNAVEKLIGWTRGGF